MSIIRTLEIYDPNLVTLGDSKAAVFVAPGLQGRIFCHLDGELIHRLDRAAVEDPSPDEFNNLGGNSLWPAPEGGPYAFNYLPDSDRWLVQDGVASQPATLVSAENGSRATVTKDICLTNRKGVPIQVRYSRSVERIEPQPKFRAKGVQAVSYVCTDLLELLGDYCPDQVLIAPWSLEQFPGGDRVTAFGLVEKPEQAINFDFYGIPETPPVYGKRGFSVALGGRRRFQIGIRAGHEPRLIGALDRDRSLVILRMAAKQEGRYFNIADNEQSAGPWSTDDMYSVFNGGELAFYELETIGAIRVVNGKIRPSPLVSTTVILNGRLSTIENIIRERLQLEI